MWVGVGGTPQSFVRAGTLGLPLMVAVIGGETHRFRPLVDLYRDAYRGAGHPAAGMRVGLHSLGYVAATDEEAHAGLLPGLQADVRPDRARARPPARDGGGGTARRSARPARSWWGSPEAVARKIVRHAEALGGIDRFTFQMDGHGRVARAAQRVDPARGGAGATAGAGTRGGGRLSGPAFVERGFIGANCFESLTSPRATLARISRPCEGPAPLMSPSTPPRRTLRRVVSLAASAAVLAPTLVLAQADGDATVAAPAEATAIDPAAEPRPSYTTRRIEGTPPAVDGDLADSSWAQVPWSETGFYQRQPDDSAPVSEETRFKILYDDRFVYVAFRAFDKSPELIEARLGRRDEFPGDWVEINFDSFNDKRTAFSFTTSVSGVRGDEFVSNDGNNWDSSWNPYWLSKARRDSLGYTRRGEDPLQPAALRERPGAGVGPAGEPPTSSATRKPARGRR